MFDVYLIVSTWDQLSVTKQPDDPLEDIPAKQPEHPLEDIPAKQPDNPLEDIPASNIWLQQRFHNAGRGKLWKRCIGTLSCCNIFQESFMSVATTLPQNIVRKHHHNIMAT